MQSKAGFSLVELSIVLVILGLLTGGILAGQSLIRAAEIRAVNTEYAKITSAFYAFRDKYFAIPGDMSNATRFWGDDNAACPDAAIPDGTPGTCNGDGDGYYANYTFAVNTTAEIYQAWKQLALAGLIEGSFTGLNGNLAAPDSNPGINVPKSRLSNAGWNTFYLNNWAGDSASFAYNSGIMLKFGSKAAGGDMQGAILSPVEAWSIDTKSDDGRPATGKIMAYRRATCTLSTSATDYEATYLLTSTTNLCAFFIKAL